MPLGKRNRLWIVHAGWLCASWVAWPVPASALSMGAVTDPVMITYGAAAQRLIGAALTSDTAYLRLSELCDDIGNRLSGTQSLEEAVRWAAETMRRDGLDVTLQPVSVKHWVRGAEQLELVAPRSCALAMLGLGGSVGTPRRGITAEVVVVRSWEELASLPDAAIQGKIVLYNVPFTSYGETVRFRSSGANEAAKRGAVATLVRSVGPVSLRTPHTGGLRYADDVQQIPAAAVAIEDAEMLDRLTSRHVPVRVRLQMEAETRPQVLSHNVIGELRGRERPEEIVILGGHLDSWDVGQGAHDDGGGCVISMEAVRLISELGLRPRRTLRVVLWTNEENGLGGARAYRDSLGDATDTHVAAIESDGGVERPVGFGVRVRHEDSDTENAARHERAVARARQLLPLFAGLGITSVNDDGGGADIGPLMERGVVGIAHRTVMEHYFDYHHTTADAVDKVDPVELRKNVAAMAVLAWVLAEMPERLDDPEP